MNKKTFIDVLSKMKPNEVQEYIQRNGKEPKKIIPFYFIRDNKLLQK